MERPTRASSPSDGRPRLEGRDFAPFIFHCRLWRRGLCCFYTSVSYHDRRLLFICKTTSLRLLLFRSSAQPNCHHSTAIPASNTEAARTNNSVKGVSFLFIYFGTGFIYSARKSAHSDCTLGRPGVFMDISRQSI